MKRIAIPASLIFSLMLLGVVLTRGMRPTMTQQGKSTKWVKSEDGVYYQLLSSGDEWPQTTVLKLSKEAYEDFSKNPAKFINEHRFFSKPVKDPLPACASLMAPQESGGDWFVIVLHAHPSIGYCAAVPEPPESEKSQRP